jgi:Leucine-rich repeat (LRR) protein
LIGLTRLNRVEFYQAALTDAGAARLAAIPTLTNVIVRDMPAIGDDGVLPLLQLPALQALSVNDTKITDRTVKAAATTATLKRLGMMGCDKITDAGLEALLAKTDLELLELGSPYPDAIKLTDAGLLKLSALKNLKKLDLQGLGKRTTYEALRTALPNTTIQWRLTELKTRATKVGGSIRVVLKSGEVVTLGKETPNSGLTDTDIKQIVEVHFPRDANFKGAALAWLLSELTDVEVLNLDDGGVSDRDLPAIEAMTGLKRLSLKGTPVTAAGIERLKKALPNCLIEWEAPAQGAQSQMWRTPEFEAWVKVTQALPAEEQVKAVVAKLVELNPGYDGGYSRSVADNAIDGFQINNAQPVTNLAPLQGFPQLRRLTCFGILDDKAKLSDLSALAGMKLEQLVCNHTQVKDLSPLEGMPLTKLSCPFTPVTDLGPLRNAPLLYLDVHNTGVSDLSPLTGAPLQKAYLTSTGVLDLTPIADPELEEVEIAYCRQFTDLSPLEKCPNLKLVGAENTKVTADAVAKLQAALPACKIRWTDSAKASGPVK